jgi:hypothetical protein
MNENLTQAIVALHKSASSIIADDELTDAEKLDAVDETFAQYHEHVAKLLDAEDDTGGAEITKETEMLHDPIEVAKRVTAGAPTRITKKEWHDEINKRAQAERRSGESPEQAYSRFLTETGDGRTLYQAFKRAPQGPQAETAAPAAKNTPEPTPSYRRLMAKAEALREAEPTLTREQAFTKVYTDPRNGEVAMAERAEHRAASSASITTVAKADHASAGDRLARCAAALARQHPDLTHAEAFQHAKERNPDLARLYEQDGARHAA